METPTQPGQGLITRILKTTKAKVYKNPEYILHPKNIKSESDHKLLQTIIAVADTQKKKGKVSKQQYKECKHAIKKLEERGALTWKLTDEWPDEI